jgi:hypothetical protein
MFGDKIWLCILSRLLENHPFVHAIITLCNQYKYFKASLIWKCAAQEGEYKRVSQNKVMRSASETFILTLTTAWHCYI